MIRVQLPDHERDTPEAEFRSAADRGPRGRLQIVPVAARGRRPAEIAEDLGVGTRAVPRWLDAYPDRGLDGLRPREAEGNPAGVPAGPADEIREWVTGGPSGCGLGRANRTYEGSAGHLPRVRGIDASRSAARRFCEKLGVRAYRPTYRFPRADPA